MSTTLLTLTRQEASILGALLRQGNECRAFSSTSVANRAQRLGLSDDELLRLQKKLVRMDAWAEEDGLT